MLPLLLMAVVVVVVVVAAVVAVPRPRQSSMRLCSRLGWLGVEGSSVYRQLGGGRVEIRSRIFEQNSCMPWGYDITTLYCF